MRDENGNTREWLKVLIGFVLSGLLLVGMAAQGYTVKRTDDNQKDLSSFKSVVSDRYLKKDDYKDALTEVKQQIKDLNDKFDRYIASH